ncbi:metal ABC transporter solute-binding protein, Zn/Mn family [Fervidibacillus albus]|uniref:Zinc ABC transporter substrate-binding protein n=1 Tax=Fervidibacillus albus TaxID=2980026 RepID=A0A9E8LSZ5_9BACI|nr:zinc ABC transporter substrate-binding protein [Fervidibacillus albus]WAA09038.1 zinc ABC transporter substrate-binding protein [Fervidibacillus albus]
MSKFKSLWVLFIVSVGTVFFITGCNSSEETSSSSGDDSTEKITIVTTIAQIAEPIEQIVGDAGQVDSLMGPGVDPHLYEATQGDITKLQNADVIFYNGLHLEGNMGEIFANLKDKKTTLGLGETIDESKLLKDEEGAIDPHIWFDIDLWKEALANATDVLKEHAPEHAETFEQNKQAYFAKMDELKQEAEEKLSTIPKEQRILVTAHDAFGYFGRMWDIEVVGLQGLSTEDEVGLSDIQSTVALLLEKQVPAVFVESSINQNSIQAVIEGAAKEGLEVELGGELFSDAMGEAGTEEGTYIGMYRHNVETIYQALSRGDES